MVSALRFKGDKKPKKRKRAVSPSLGDPSDPSSGPSKSAKTSTIAAAPAGSAEDEEGWVNTEVPEDLNGPLIFVFPVSSTSPVTLACDALGSVFASPLSSLPTGSEELDKAEPDDVKQVWVVTKIHGMEKYSLKAHTGKYLACDKHGLLSATREAISPEEMWEIAEAPIKGSGRWGLRSVREGWLGAEERDGKVLVRGDRSDMTFTETWCVRCQKRFKKKVKVGSGEQGRVKDRITRRELEEIVGMPLDDDQVKKLKRARKDGGFHEALLDVRVKYGKHDKFAH